MKYKLVKVNQNYETLVDYFNIQGLIIKPKKDSKYNKLKVSKLVLTSPPFIDRVLKKKIKRKLNTYLNYIIESDSDDSDDSDHRQVLGDLERYKSIVINRYAKFLDRKYIEILLKKITLFEQKVLTELKKEVKKYKPVVTKEEKIGKSR